MPSKPSKCRHFDSTRQNLTGPVVGGGGPVLAHQDSGSAHWGSLGLFKTRFGSSGPTRVIQWCTLLHWDLDFTQQGSLGLKFGSSGLTGTQIWLIRAHRHALDTDLAHRGSLEVIRTQIWLIDAHWDSDLTHPAHLNSDLVH